MTDALRIAIQRMADFSEVDRRAIDEIDRQAFTGEDMGLTWSTPEWYVTGRLDDEIVSIVGILQRDCLLDGQPLRLAGISGVATLLQYRRRGFASTLMRAAGDFMREHFDAGFALLLCAPTTMPMYARVGWQVIQGPMLFSQPDGSRHSFEEILMVLLLRDTPWPGGAIDLCGLPW
jgi:GNAT superfamily N-acetyltransferase